MRRIGQRVIPAESRFSPQDVWAAVYDEPVLDHAERWITNRDDPPSNSVPADYWLALSNEV
jgi:hypothetical protein